MALRVNWPFRKTPAESGHRPLFNARMGACLGSTFLSAPFVRVTTYDDFVVIAPMLLGSYVLRRSDGVRIEREVASLPFAPIRQTRVFLRHTLSRVPQNVCLLPRDADALESALTASLGARDPASRS